MELIPSAPPAGFRASIAQTYDNVAADREEMGEADWRWPLAERFLDKMRAAGLSRLLEIGAGVGFTSRWFADQGLDVVATDLSPDQVELCRAKGLDAHVRDMYDLGFPPESFDALWSMNCVHHLPNSDFPQILQGFSDVLRPNGIAYIGVWGGIDDEGIPKDDFYLPPRFFCLRSDETLVSMVEDAFEIESFETFQPKEGDTDGMHIQSLFLRVKVP